MSLDSAIEYALFFSSDAVHLRRRERPATNEAVHEAAHEAAPAPDAAGRTAAPAWRHLGSVDFDSADFRGEFQRLRVMSGAPDGAGDDDAMLPVTLIIPDDQILYTTLTVPPGADREHAVGRALDGLTPYRIEDLAFDWDGDGDSVRVAAVARQTLREAQDFAAQYGFDGQQFRAVPASGGYPGEPIFLLDAVRPAHAARAAVDPAQVSVTSPDLLIETDDEDLAEAEAEGQGVLDLDLGGDSQEAEADQSPIAEPEPEAEEAEIPKAAVEAAEPEAVTPDAGETATEEAGTTDSEDDEGISDSLSEVAADPEPQASLSGAARDGGAEDEGADDAASLAAFPAEPVSAGAGIPAADEPAAAADEPAEPQPEVAASEPEAPETTAHETMTPETAAPETAARESAEPDGADADAAAARDAAAATVAATAAATAAAQAGARSAPPVVRHAPARPSNAPRPAEKVGPAPEVTRPALNPRARAVHDRAAEARSARSAGAAPAAVARVGQRGGLLGLVGMLGALVVGLILIWAFVVPAPRQAATEDDATQAGQIAANGDASPAQTAPAPVEPPSAAPDNAASVPPVQEAAQPPVQAALDPAQTPPASATLPQDAPVTDTMAAGTPDTSQTPVPADPAIQSAGLAGRSISALTEEERRRVIVAAAAVAAAVVPPAYPAAVSDPQTGTAENAPALSQNDPADAAPPHSAATQPAISAVAPAQRPSRDTQEQAVERALRAAIEGGGTTAATATAATPPASARLTSSARPQLAPRRSTPRTTTPQADTVPAVPANPLPYEATQRRVQPASSARPPARAGRPAAIPANAPARSQPPASTQSSASPALAPPATTASNAGLRGSARPPLRPEGSAPELIDPEPGPSGDDALTPAEQSQLDDLIRDLRRLDLATATTSRPALAAGQGVLLAQARPARKPGGARASDAVSPSAIDAALRSATTSPPDKPAALVGSATPARDSGGLLRGSDRPRSRPASLGGGAAVAGLSDKAVEAAISAAVDASPATPGGVRLSALNSSPLPPRRSDDAPSAERPDPAPDAAASAAPPAAAGPSEAELAERRKLDEQLQAQAEARVRARAQADAQAEARARAQAESRARAQAEAEERAARAKRQEYKPPEVDNEPEIAATALSKGTTAASVAKAATQTRGIDMGRTTIIGIIGAGQASRALIRLRNGKIVTVRLGDRIDGGQINSIGNGRLTYVKGGRTHELRLLDGR